MAPPVPAAPLNAIQTPTGDLDGQIHALRNEYEALRQQKIEFERHEVKVRDQLNPAEQQSIVVQKRKFITDLDVIRRRIKQLETMQDGTPVAGAVPTHTFVNSIESMPPFMAKVPVPAAAPTMLSMNGVKEFDWPTLPSNNVVPNGVNPHSKAENANRHVPASEASPTSRAPRRSHAIEIKDPNTHRPVKDISSSALNPTSPSYEPGKPFPLVEGSPPAFVVPAPSPIDTPNMPPAELAKQYPWVFGTDNNDSDRASYGGMEPTSLRSSQSHGITVIDDGRDHHNHTPQHQTSQSSVTTTDFFPLNTHEHSFGKYMLRKASGGDNHPATPQRDYQHDFISPMSEQQHHVRAPPVSPADQIDFRMSSFLRSVAMPCPDDGFNRVSWMSTDSAKYYLGEHLSNTSGQSPPVSEDIRKEFEGKSQLYLEGYVAAVAGGAPAEPSNREYVDGYCHGLKVKSSQAVQHNSRSASTISLKSDSLTHSKTPPNTAERSYTSLAPVSTSAENVRLSQAGGYLPAHSGFGQHGSAPSASGNHQVTSSSYPPDHSKGNSFSHYGVHPTTNFAPLDRALSEARMQNNSSYSADLPDTIWEHSRSVPSLACRSKESITANPIPVGRDRIMSANQASNLMGYSGNRHEVNSRMVSTPHRDVYGEDKYGFTSLSEPRSKIDSKFAQCARQSRDRSANSQLDGAMDDLAEMVTPPTGGKSRGSATRDSHQSVVGTIGSQRPSVDDSAYRGPVPPPGHRARFPTDPVSPPSSPSKSTSSPKKITSPKHRIQQIARGMLGAGSGSDRSGPSSRPESPDPKKMGPEAKRQWKEEWRTKFSHLKNKETEGIRKYKKENPL